ncbi:MAG: hypothetical protein IJY36_04625 [Coprobacter sp.]|nr:hypothetical protein [Coprobacter sp.]
MKRYIPALLLLATLSVNAQETKKDPLQREVVIEKEFTPIVQDASKINTIPEMEVSTSARPDIRYADWTTPYETTPEVNTLPAGDNGVEAPEKQKGYARISIGNYLNLNANAGIHLLNTTKNQLSLWYDHNSTNGKLSYLQIDEKTKQRRNDNKLYTCYAHNFGKLIWNINADYRYNTFNYYGLPLAYDKNDMAGLSETGDQQTVQHYGINTTLSSKPNDVLNYSISLGYKGYNSDLGTYYGTRGGIENHINACIDANAPFKDHYNVGIELSIDNLTYSRIHDENYTILGVNPYFTMQKNGVEFRAGAQIDLSFNDNTIFRIAPDLRFQWEFKKSCFIYAHLTGGKEINSLARLSDITSYISPNDVVTNTYTPADLSLGIRSTVLNTLHFSIYGGIKYSVDALFDYRMQNIDVTALSGILSRNVISFKAMDAYVWKAGFDLSYKPCNFFAANLGWEHNEWRKSNSRERIKFSQPRNTWKAGITTTPIKALDIKADFYFADGLGYTNEVSGIMNYTEADNLPNIVNLNIGAIYRLNKHIHFLAQLNNLLSKKYEIFYGMPAQRCHFLVGAGVVF